MNKILNKLIKNRSMRSLIILKRTLLFALGLCLITPVLAQKKNKVRIKAQFINVIDQGAFIEISGSSRIDRKNTAVSDIVFNVYDNTDSKRTKIGSTTTDENGEATFALSDFNTMEADSTGLYKIQVVFDGNDNFAKAKKNIEFKKAKLTAKVIQKDSLNFITAQLLDGLSMEPITDEIVTVQVQRLFKPLRIGEEFNATDESGTIEAMIPNDIPGIDGMLNLEVVLSDNDDYGTVKAIVSSPVGVPAAIEDNFNKRAMWGTAKRAPLYILIFTNVLLLGIAILFIYLTRNLINISKS